MRLPSADVRLGQDEVDFGADQEVMVMEAVVVGGVVCGGCYCARRRGRQKRGDRRRSVDVVDGRGVRPVIVA